MQAITHLLTGILIEKTCTPISRPSLKVGVMAVIGILSHGLLDRLARLTYHPANAHWHDLFWIAFHIPIYISAMVVFIHHWGRYKLGMIFAMLPDFDWLIIKPLSLFGIQIKTNLHDATYAVIDSIPILNQTAQIPSLTEQKQGVILELVFILFLSIVSINLNNNHRSDAT